MGEITQLFQAARDGDTSALDKVFSRVYLTLRALAGSRLNAFAGESTLSPTALVHETYLKLISARSLDIIDHQHFFACAARTMRQILIDHARARVSQCRGGTSSRVDLDNIDAATYPDHDLLDLDAALNTLNGISKELLELVELRVFAGMTMQQLAVINNRSLRSINRDWQRARALLLSLMSEQAK